MKNDLHLHTNFSACADKNNSWEKLLGLAQKNGLDRISITDHDTCIFHVINKFKDVSQFFKGEIISGMECDVVEDGLTFELLAYNFDVIPIFNWAFKVYGTLEIRQTRIKNELIKLLKKNNLKFNSKKYFNCKTDYAHNYIYENIKEFKENSLIFKKYNINSVTDFYRLSTTNKDFPLYINMSKFWPNVDKVVSAIHKAGGIVVLAHPFNYKDNIDIDKLLQIIINNKIDGVEVFHPSCDKNKINYLLNFANNHNLVVTGGSDYHGTKRHNIIGIENLVDNQDIIFRI